VVAVKLPADHCSVGTNSRNRRTWNVDYEKVWQARQQKGEWPNQHWAELIFPGLNQQEFNKQQIWTNMFHNFSLHHGAKSLLQELYRLHPFSHPNNSTPLSSHIFVILAAKQLIW